MDGRSPSAAGHSGTVYRKIVAMANLAWAAVRCEWYCSSPFRNKRLFPPTFSLKDLNNAMNCE